MTRIKLNYLLIGIITLFLALALWPNISWHQGKGEQLSEIKSRGELRVSTLRASTTFFNTQPNDQGIDYELVKHFADYLGVKLTIVPEDNLNQVFDDISHDRADISAAGLIYNTRRLQSFRAGPEYYSISQQLLYRIGTPRPKTLADIKGSLIVSQGSAYADTLQQLSAKIPGLNWNNSGKFSTQELMEQISSGKLDYTVADSVTTALMQRIHPQLAVAFDLTENEPVNWYFAKNNSDDSLYAAMLDFFNQLNEDGTLEKLEEKYFGHVGSFDYVDTKTFLNAIDTKLPLLRPLFEKYAGTLDWRLLAAIAYQESHWDPLATSPTGVRGMMMLTRTTASGLDVDNRLNVEQSIKGGAQYLLNLINKMPQSISPDERIWFALAAYNMGFGHMLDARKLTSDQKGNPDSWSDVKQRLSLLDQKRYYSQTAYGYAHGNQAYNYVENIRRYQLSLVGYLQDKEKQQAQKSAILTQLGDGYPAVPVGQALAGTP